MAGPTPSDLVTMTAGARTPHNSALAQEAGAWISKADHRRPRTPCPAIKASCKRPPKEGSGRAVVACAAIDIVVRHTGEQHPVEDVSEITAARRERVLNHSLRILLSDTRSAAPLETRERDHRYDLGGNPQGQTARHR
ncbi:MAG: hypothetical protein M0Z68_04560 [Gammaproteobacteria bacterium]|nr:hypothetical protein [Gammaproteobacteria bacterium]